MPCRTTGSLSPKPCGLDGGGQLSALRPSPTGPCVLTNTPASGPAGTIGTVRSSRFCLSIVRTAGNCPMPADATIDRTTCDLFTKSRWANSPSRYSARRWRRRRLRLVLVASLMARTLNEAPAPGRPSWSHAIQGGPSSEPHIKVGFSCASPPYRQASIHPLCTTP